MIFTGFMDVKIDRDSVHPGDDLESHAIPLSVTLSTTIGVLLQQVNQSGFLPGISGGEATWLVDVKDGKAGCIGVMAQQWQEPRLIIPMQTPVSDLLYVNQSSFYFRYWCQAAPEIVFESVLNGRELPDKHSRSTADPAQSGAAVAAPAPVRSQPTRIAASSAQPPDQKEGKYTWLNIAVFLWGLGGLICIIPILCMFPFMFDKPGSAADPLAWLMILLQFSFPVVCVFSSLTIWVLKKRNRRLAYGISLLPFFSLIIILGSMLVESYFNQGRSTFQDQGQIRQAAQCDVLTPDGGDGLATSGCGRLDRGWSATGLTKTTSEAQNWQFSTLYSPRIGIAVQNDGKTCPQITILDFNGKLVEGFVNENGRRSCLSGMTETSVYYFNPPVAGIYIIRLVTPGTAGAYWLKLQ